MRLVYHVLIPDHYYGSLLTIGYLSRSGMFWSLADSHFGLVSMDFVMIDLFVIAYASSRMVTHRVIMIF